MRNLIKKVIVLLLALSILIFPEIQVNASQDIKTTFKDVKSTSWYFTYVTKLADLKITGGYEDGTYRPNNSVTRAEFVTFLCNVKGYKQMQGNPFIDSRESWASGYITAALANGIIDIPADQKFYPNYAITRLEAVEMMCRALNISADEKMETPYTDVKDNKGYSTAAYSNYLMQGSLDKDKRYFYPGTKITRAETATIIVNAYDYNLDKMAYLNKRIEEEKAKKEEAEKYAAWQESVKGISPSLLNNKDYLKKGSVYESNKYLKEETTFMKNWGAKYGMTEDELANEVVRVGNDIMNLWYNADYRKLDVLEKGFKSIADQVFIINYMKRNIEYVKNNKFVSEGKFQTSTGLIIIEDDGDFALRGTIKYRYLSPTSDDVLKSEIVGSTGKQIVLNTWYEQDYRITFYPEETGLKFTGMDAISAVRLCE
ncbi:S-layer homology domain-containing protein [Ruminiclostridium cellobioparum]|uniref:S-layer protein n=1 Tax=Ruminiclostridium cellobioparum subsp. termitidis CT1112 TaxID=1195236 RepID=S0FPH7_RUMCE|nr:S-layer homology domain-containing protein [Ruminiclostridium cellobioparum]EMS72261.1 S-layer protein [Ruminiclostridium cellobioparum subsp. termitidis CT1112]